MQNFAVYINPDFSHKKNIYTLLEKLKDNSEINFFSIDSIPDLPKELFKPMPKPANRKHIDCILVFGGDGTILKAKDIALLTGAPILGINLGYLGFLSESVLPEIASSIENLKQGKYRLLQRMLINCRLKREGKIIYEALALNDAVIYKAESPGLIHIRIKASSRYVFDTRCDGIIAATPTGSTAYSLSAGGPILAPEMKAIVLSPLNPHILAIRPMVFPSTELLTMKVYGLRQAALLQIDGQNVMPIQEGDEVLVTSSQRSVSFIKLSNRTFYQILRRKLNLGK
ncbi:MAG TPA: NAD(+)/NADH kinase [Candidatus Cloacimonas sp.]|mgnify:FL=1|jgi:NAD+ kinase|nr:NAD(+)/NADH kinase [Candidatus Cloacimonas sp.]MDD2250403.1 NAD(+)/NADH kinase [Candidatus Cloacimonadota bacterium]MCK9164626.1 NAD(+)/NADH kinase [Candidatus Cloacimonas sp.]MDD3734296.1 NAD(+)/NADH kinase [Candidatus Cloacimonadota bacterium]MDD3870156.1 NAD(+)/NADH kinase [Candidatus Cloacimonadota bacterium]